MPQSNFGAGYLFGVPSGANPSPRMFGAVQDVSVDFSFDLKQLHGQGQFAIEQGRGKGKIDIKASAGRVDPLLFNDMFFGLSASTGEVLGSQLEAFSIPATPFTVTVANGVTFRADLGVLDVATGLFMTRVASGPTTGQYSVNTTTGVYTFASADTGKAVKISYTYGSTTTGKTIVGTNTVMGSGPVFALHLVNTFRSKTLYLSFPAVQSSKLSMPLKLDDFLLPALEMSAQDDGTGSVFTFSATG